jgi:hypothetical protein
LTVALVALTVHQFINVTSATVNEEHLAVNGQPSEIPTFML